MKLVDYSKIRSEEAIEQLIDKIKFHSENNEDIDELSHLLKTYGRVCTKPVIKALENRLDWENEKPEFSKGSIKGLLSTLVFNFDYLTTDDKNRISKILDSNFENRFIYDFRFPEDVYFEIYTLKGKISGKSEAEINAEAKTFFETTSLEIKRRKNQELEKERHEYLASFKKPSLEEFSDSEIINKLYQAKDGKRDLIESLAKELNIRHNKKGLNYSSQDQQRIRKKAQYYLNLTKSKDIQKREIGRTQLEYLGGLITPVLLKYFQDSDQKLKIEATNVFISSYDRESLNLLSEELKIESDFQPFFSQTMSLTRLLEFFCPSISVG